MKKGFSLVEMLIIIAILVILVVMVVTGIGEVLRRTRLAEGVNLVTAVLSQARNEAIVRQRPVLVRVENQSREHQAVSLYIFPLAKTLALAEAGVSSEEYVQTVGGWDANSRILYMEFPVYKHGRRWERYNKEDTTSKEGDKTKGRWIDEQYKEHFDEPDLVRFETCYFMYLDPDSHRYISPLWNEQSGTPNTLRHKINVFPSYNNGKAEDMDWSPFGGHVEEAVNLIPKTLYNNGSCRPKLLCFNPDGTASANVVFLIRTDKQLKYVRVAKGGRISSGEILRLSPVTEGFDACSLVDVLGYPRHK